MSENTKINLNALLKKSDVSVDDNSPKITEPLEDTTNLESEITNLSAIWVVNEKKIEEIKSSFTLKTGQETTEDKNNKVDFSEGKVEKEEDAPKPEVINNTEPLWKKDPAELKDEDYKEFYRQLFPMDPEPLFWLHLNVDHPFTLQGILFFPKILIL